jgi:hypothetical protein
MTFTLSSGDNATVRRILFMTLSLQGTKCRC